MQVIFDTKGTIFFQGSGFPEPVGELGYLKVDVPEGHYLKEIDMSTGNPEPVFEAYPKSDMELLKERMKAIEAENAELKAQQEALIQGASEITGGENK